MWVATQKSLLGRGTTALALSSQGDSPVPSCCRLLPVDEDFFFHLAFPQRSLLLNQCFNVLYVFYLFLKLFLWCVCSGGGVSL